MLGTGLAAIEHVESLSGREVQALRQLVGHTANLIAENHFLYLRSLGIDLFIFLLFHCISDIDWLELDYVNIFDC